MKPPVDNPVGSPAREEKTMSEFGNYVDETLEPMQEQMKIHSFSNDLTKLLKKYDVTLKLVQEKMVFGFGGGWYFSIDLKTEDEDE